MTKGVPIGRFYSVIAIVAVSVGVLAYFAGETAGEVETRYKAAQRGLERQKEIYTNDLEVEKERPLSGDYTAWKRWMRNHI